MIAVVDAVSLTASQLRKRSRPSVFTSCCLAVPDPTVHGWVLSGVSCIAVFLVLGSVALKGNTVSGPYQGRNPASPSRTGSELHVSDTFLRSPKNVGAMRASRPGVWPAGS